MTRSFFVTGAAGFVGWQLLDRASREGPVVGTVHRTKARHPVARLEVCDIADFAALKGLVRKTSPRAIIHAAALSQPNICQAEPKTSRRVNVEASANLAGLAADLSVPFVYISSDLVFDGKSAPYVENASPNPVSLYGEHKAMAEEKVRETYPQASIFRLPLMFGPATPGSANFTQEFLRKMRAGSELALFVDEFRTPISSLTAADAVIRFHSHEEPILHLGGRKSWSRHEMGQEMANAFGIPTARIRPVRQADVVMPAPRPRDVSFDSSRAFALGFDPPDLRDELRALKNHL